MASAVRLGLPRGKFVRLERENKRGEWQFIEAYRLEDALSVPLSSDETLSCGCGSYPMGYCELCNDEAGL